MTDTTGNNNNLDQWRNRDKTHSFCPRLSLGIACGILIATSTIFLVVSSVSVHYYRDLEFNDKATLHIVSCVLNSYIILYGIFGLMCLCCLQADYMRWVSIVDQRPTATTAHQSLLTSFYLSFPDQSTTVPLNRSDKLNLVAYICDRYHVSHFHAFNPRFSS